MKSKLLILVALIGCLACSSKKVASAPAASAPQTSFAVAGTLITPGEVVEKGALLVSGGKIEWTGRAPALPAGVSALDVQGVIFAGPIDLHNHITWNAFRRWKPGRRFASRYEWIAGKVYENTLDKPRTTLVAAGLENDLIHYGEYKSIAGGATDVIGGATFKAKFPHLHSEVRPLELPFEKANALRLALASDSAESLVVHLAEGVDAASQREFAMLKARGFVRPGVSIIHGITLGEKEFREMASLGMGLIWALTSNLELYGKTADVAGAKAAGVPLAISPDWSLTGSQGMLSELRSVWRWNLKHKLFDEAELVKMATLNPAKLARVDERLGSLEKGKQADFIVMRPKKASPYQALLNASPADLKLVVVGGRALYGDLELMRTLAQPGQKLETLSICGAAKALDVTGQELGLGTTQEKIKAQLAKLKLPMGSLVVCD